MNDLGGGERLRDIWKHYLAESFGFIWVVDSSNRARIDECKNEFAKFIENDKVFGKPILM
jgi:GTPase SAR1 family protein